ncbi:aldehyde dehydrogenase family protein, partial [Pseudomonas helleri]
MSTVTGHNFIGGRRSAAGTTTLESLNASTGEALPYRFYQATADEVNDAANAADHAFVAFRQLSPERRAEFLDAVAEEIDQLGDDFVAIVCAETALPAARIQGERGRTSGQMRLFAKVLRRGDFLGARIDLALPDRKPLPRVDLRQYRIGVGAVAV